MLLHAIRISCCVIIVTLRVLGAHQEVALSTFRTVEHLRSQTMLVPDARFPASVAAVDTDLSAGAQRHCVLITPGESAMRLQLVAPRPSPCSRRSRVTAVP